MIHEHANVESGVLIDSSTQVWSHTHIRSGSRIGKHVILGENVFIDSGVTVGDHVKIQNSAQIFSPAVIESGVFIGPGVILTNDKHPRAVNPDMSLKKITDWEPTGVYLEEGSSLGAGVICVAPVRIGRWALVGAGSVVIRDVPPNALVVGNPATQIGWVNSKGTQLSKTGIEGVFLDEQSGESYQVIDGALEMRKNK
jgi:UDP-2-acetamido-3-amino-2,3-dideoxy-glucuronate N-acetyltransferase